MKKYYLLLLCCLALTAGAQTLRVNRGTIHEVFNATADEMLFAGTGSDATLTIGGVTYAVSDIDNIVIGNEAVEDGTVTVTYSDGTADVVIAGNIAPYLTTTVNGADVTLDTDVSYTDMITYTLTGSTSAGSFTMDGKNNTTLILNNVSINSTDTAAINIRNGKHCYITVNDTNTFADGAQGGQKAAFFCNGHATFSGSGTLNITGNARHAYRSDEYTIFGTDFTGTVNVLAAASDGINVQQYLIIHNGTFNIANNVGDGIDVGINNDNTKSLNGQLFIHGGTINADAINADTKGIKADSLVTITGGTFTINVKGDGGKGIVAGTDFRTNGGTFNITLTGGDYAYTNENGEEDSSRCQGIRSKADFYLLGTTDSYPTFNITNNSSSDKAYGIRVKGWLYYVADVLKLSGFNTKDAKWTSGQASKIDNFDL